MYFFPRTPIKKTLSDLKWYFHNGSSITSHLKCLIDSRRLFFKSLYKNETQCQPKPVDLWSQTCHFNTQAHLFHPIRRIVLVRLSCSLDWSNTLSHHVHPIEFFVKLRWVWTSTYLLLIKQKIIIVDKMQNCWFLASFIHTWVAKLSKLIHDFSCVSPLVVIRIHLRFITQANICPKSNLWTITKGVKSQWGAFECENYYLFVYKLIEYLLFFDLFVWKRGENL